MSLWIDHDIFQIIYQIDLTATDHLEEILSVKLLSFLFRLCLRTFVQILPGMKYIRKCLYHTVICDRDRRMSPFICPLYNIDNIGNTVHIAHFGMAVQFYTFFCTVIHSGHGKIFCLLQTLDRDCKIFIKTVHCAKSPDKQKGTLFDTFPDIREFFIRTEHLTFHRIRKVCNEEADDRLFVTDLTFFYAQYLTADRDLSHFIQNLIHRNDLTFHIIAIQYIRVVRTLALSAEALKVFFAFFFKFLFRWLCRFCLLHRLFLRLFSDLCICSLHRRCSMLKFISVHTAHIHILTVTRLGNSRTVSCNFRDPACDLNVVLFPVSAFLRLFICHFKESPYAASFTDDLVQNLQKFPAFLMIQRNIFQRQNDFIICFKRQLCGL